MPSIRLPFTRKKHLPPNATEIVLSSPGVAGTAPQPPLTLDDPRLRAFLGVTFDVLYDWNIPTGAIYFSERLDHILGLPAGGFPRTLEGWLETCTPTTTSASATSSGRASRHARRSAANTGCATAMARTASSRTRASSW